MCIRDRANRLGGNSLADIIIFGRRAGMAASKYSRNIDQQMRSNKAIAIAHENINKFIKNGNELVRPLQNELRLIMWKYCGVIKNETLLLEGLSKIESIKTKLSDVDVRICLLYTSPSPRDGLLSRMPSSA